MAIHVALYQPEIPANTGNIARTCAATNVDLHLIRPLGFSTDDKMLRRAGLDYWEFVNVHYYDGIKELFAKYLDAKFYYIETVGEKFHSEIDFSNVEEDVFFVFGSESSGLPKNLLEMNKNNCLLIPMTENVRSLNLSNTAAILIYEALRQRNYPLFR